MIVAMTGDDEADDGRWAMAMMIPVMAGGGDGDGDGGDGDRDDDGDNDDNDDGGDGGGGQCWWRSLVPTLPAAMMATRMPARTAMKATILMIATRGHDADDDCDWRRR